MKNEKGPLDGWFLWTAIILLIYVLSIYVHIIYGISTMKSEKVTIEHPYVQPHNRK
jgi:hypothetical protein